MINCDRQLTGLRDICRTSKAQLRVCRQGTICLWAPSKCQGCDGLAGKVGGQLLKQPSLFCRRAPTRLMFTDLPTPPQSDWSSWPWPDISETLNKNTFLLPAGIC